MQKNLKDNLNQSSISSRWALRIEVNIELLVFLSRHWNWGLTIHVSIYGLNPTASRGNTCFLCQITHHLHLMTPVASYHLVPSSEELTTQAVILQHLPLWFRNSHIHAYESFTHIFSVYVNLSLEAVSIVSNVTSMQCPAECLLFHKHGCSPPFWKPHSCIEELHCTLHHLETTLECDWALQCKNYI